MGFNKYSFLIKCTDDTVCLVSMWGKDYHEAKANLNLNKEWELIVSKTFIENWIAKENKTRDDNPAHARFFEELDQLEKQNNAILTSKIEIKRYTDGLNWELTPSENITIQYFIEDEFNDIAYDVVKAISEKEKNEIRWNKKGLSNGHYVGSMHKFNNFYKNKKLI